MITQRCLRLRHLEQSRRIGERLLGHGFEPLRHNRRSEFPFLVRGVLLPQIRPLIPATR
jgi:hypothetical protein